MVLNKSLFGSYFAYLFCFITLFVVSITSKLLTEILLYQHNNYLSSSFSYKNTTFIAALLLCVILFVFAILRYFFKVPIFSTMILFPRKKSKYLRIIAIISIIATLIRIVVDIVTNKYILSQYLSTTVLKNIILLTETFFYVIYTILVLFYCKSLCLFKLRCRRSIHKHEDFHSINYIYVRTSVSNYTSKLGDQTYDVDCENFKSFELKMNIIIPICVSEKMETDNVIDSLFAENLDICSQSLIISQVYLFIPNKNVNNKYIRRLVNLEDFIVKARNLLFKEIRTETNQIISENTIENTLKNIRKMINSNTFYYCKIAFKVEAKKYISLEFHRRIQTFFIRETEEITQKKMPNKTDKLILDINTTPYIKLLKNHVPDDILLTHLIPGYIRKEIALEEEYQGSFRCAIIIIRMYLNIYYKYHFSQNMLNYANYLKYTMPGRRFSKYDAPELYGPIITQFDMT